MAHLINEQAATTLPMSGGTLDVGFTDREDLEQQNTNFIKNMGLFVGTKVQPKPFSEFDLILHLPNGKKSAPLHARLVQVVPYGDQPGLMLQLMQVPDAVTKSIETALKPQEPAKPSWKEARDGATKDDDKGPSGDRMTMYEKFRKMRPDERARVAKTGNKTERNLLMRDSEPVVLQFLLQNHNITRGEVLEISKLKTLNYNLINMILSNRQWTQIEELRFNLAMNPKTPSPTVLKLIPTLTMKHIREMAKNQGLRTQIKQAALRIVLAHADGR